MDDSPRVGAKLREFVAADPLGRAAGDDPWRDFRRIEVIDLRLEFRFRHSLGKASRFFLELERGKLFGTRCPRCGAVWLPPRAACGHDLAVTEWVELPPRGTLAAATECAYTLTTGGGKDHMMLGYVAIEGASTLLLHQIRNFGAPARLAPGLPVRVAWAEGPVHHPMELFWFEPA